MGASRGDAKSTLRIRVLQTDPQLGDVTGNLERLESQIAECRDVDLVVTPELATHGYHLGDLPDSAPLSRHDARLARLGSHGPTVVVGFVEQNLHLVHNAAAVLGPETLGVQRKLYLPTYWRWEERKHFTPGTELERHDVAGVRLSVIICNDLWQPVVPWLAVHAGAEVLVVPVNSVVSAVGSDTAKVWETILLHAALTLQCYVVFVNRVGTESGSTFWGGSRVISPEGEVLEQLDDEPGEFTVDLDLERLRRLRREWPLLSESRAEFVTSAAGNLAKGIS
nr:nitrilase-related carbon-nitrogen hydrolase [Nocardioides panzhihuensis]